MKDMSIKKVLFALVGLVTGIQVSADDTFYDNGFTYSLKGNKRSRYIIISLFSQYNHSEDSDLL